MTPHEATDGMCPISHIPLSELRLATTFRSDARVVYDAEYLVEWLRRGWPPRNPMTNAAVPARVPAHVLLRACGRSARLPAADAKATLAFLRAQGPLHEEPSLGGFARLRWRQMDERGRVEWIGVCAYALVLISMLFVCELMLRCAGAQLLQPDARTILDPRAPLEPLSGVCVWVPGLMLPLQLVGLGVTGWAFPEIRRYFLLTLAATVAGFLITFVTLTTVVGPDGMRAAAMWLLERVVLPSLEKLPAQHVDPARAMARLLVRVILETAEDDFVFPANFFFNI